MLLENKLYAGPLPVKLYYLGPMFRYDRPQAGRYRQFHQFGVEAFGSNEPSLDAEVIAMAWDIYLHLGLTNLTLELNSVGCPKCRKEHAEKLRAYLQTKLQDLYRLSRTFCKTLWILDCKQAICQEIVNESL